ncbi:MAG: restriction endonuclease subunit S [Bacteroidota bacterium]
MEVKPGYQQTELGIIPEDWSTASLLEIAESLDNLRVPLNETQRQRMQGNIPYCGANGVVDYINKYILDDDIILMAEDGGYFDEHASRPIAYRIKGKCWVNNHAHILKAKLGHDQGFLYFSLVHKNILPFLASGTRAKLNKSEMQKIIVQVPPTESEQRAIATALSDVDALLAGLDRLIAKKRDLKQAAMQQLLTGQTRLPGFSGEWEVKRLGEIANIKTGSRNNEDKIEDGEYPFFVRSEIVERINSYSHDCEAILVPGEGRIGDIFHYINGRFDVHQRVYAITQFRPTVSAKFVHLYMAMNFGAWAMQNTVKATVDSLRLPTFQTFEMLVPPTKVEQTAIATVLSDMDAELAALKARRDKTRDLKQAMMQELLTGKIRLSTPIVNQ